jgi:predicted nucleic acid-binding protein
MRRMSPTPTPRNISPLLRKRGKSDADVSTSLRYLQHLVELVDRESYGAFEDEARQRLRGRDESDWPVLATALALSYPIWTEDADFFGTGIAVWTTSRVEIFLKAQTNSAESEDI